MLPQQNLIIDDPKLLEKSSRFHLMSPEDKYELITRDLDEVLGEQKLKEILKFRNPILYFGTATTGSPHIGYLAALLKLAHYLKAGCQVKILFADLHAALDAMKSSWEQLKYRTEYYEFVIKNTLKAIGVSIDNLEFVKGSDFQLTSAYTLDIYKLMSFTTLRNANKAGAEVVKQSNNITINSLVYPILQALDEEYLGVDGQVGGTDQRKIFTYAEKHLPMIGYQKRIHLMNRIIPSLSHTGILVKNDTSETEKTKVTKKCGLCQTKVEIEVRQSVKMNSSSNDKIDLLDTPKKIKKKINSAFCEPGNVTSGIFIFIRFVVFPILEIRDQDALVIERKEEYGGNAIFKTFEELCIAYMDESLHPGDLKAGISNFLIDLLSPVREAADNKEIKELILKSY
jgi:tyrosyl-tRNA synthetase